MLKRLTVWVFVPILIVCGVLITASFLRVPVPIEEQQYCLQTAQQAHDKHPNCRFEETLLERGMGDPVAYYTLWLTLFTGALAVVGIGQGFLTSQQISLAREAMGTDRAWVTAIAMNGHPSINTKINGVPYEKAFVFIARLKNSGRTPALKVDVYSAITVAPIATEKVPQFIPNWPPAGVTSATIGPEIVVSGAPQAVGGADCDAVLARTAKVYVFVAIRYHDIFYEEKTRTTEVTFEVICDGTRIENGRETPNFQAVTKGPQNIAT